MGTRPARISLVLSVAALGACSSGGGAPAKPPAPPKPVAVVEAGTCPTEGEASADKIVGATAMKATGRRMPVEITVRAASLPAVPACPEGDEPERTCRARDLAFAERRFLNTHEIDCVILALGPVLTSFTPSWYERPHHTTLGETVPVALGFWGNLTWDEVQRVAVHPFVERVAVAPGAVAAVGGPVPPASAECPGPADDEAADAAAAKLQPTDALHDPGRHAAIVALKTDAILPARVTCAQPMRCLEAPPAAWERTILNTRQATCVRRRLDQVVMGWEGDVDYTSLDNTDVGLMPLPPLGQTPFLLDAFAVGLTWDEALSVARHPYVQQIGTSPGVVLLPPPGPECLIDPTAPIPPRDCPVARDDGTGKVSPSSVELLSRDGPQIAIVMVSGGTKACMYETCRTDLCPAQDELEGYRTRKSRVEQQCVRDLIASVGGIELDSVNTLSEASTFVAALTWAQTQVVVTHPHVLSIEAAVTGIPP